MAICHWNNLICGEGQTLEIELEAPAGLQIHGVDPGNRRRATRVARSTKENAAPTANHTNCRRSPPPAADRSYACA